MEIPGGFLINLEGCEGCGKTLQIRYLTEELRNKGFAVFPTREPGGTSIGDQIREVLHDMQNFKMHTRTETLLFQAARAQIVEEVVKPHLLEGEIVILDRFYDTTIAYQGFGHQQNISKVHHLVNYATGGLEPDLTVLLDVDVEEGLKRKKTQEEWNRMDAYEIDFHKRNRAGYHKMAEIDARWIMVDANNNIESVRRDLTQGILQRMWYRGLIEKAALGHERA